MGRVLRYGNGEMTGTHWIKEAGWFTGPITITNTFSIGIAHHATIRWIVQRFPAAFATPLWILPVAAETFDGWLNDITALAVTEADVLAAIDGATSGPVMEGSVGGGTGMIAYGFKGGTGTASRRVSVRGEKSDTDFTVGVLVQANHGLRSAVPWSRRGGGRGRLERHVGSDADAWPARTYSTRNRWGGPAQTDPW
jgi:L-aminopeptidase/D-esterase-like protein